MSPGKPGAGGAERRRRSWRRRRRRRPRPRPPAPAPGAEAAAEAAAPGPRRAALLPGSFRGARSPKPGGAGAQPRLCLLLSLGLLLLRFGQIAVAGDCDECGQMTLSSNTTEIHLIDLPENFSISNVTSEGRYVSWSIQTGSTVNKTIVGLSPGETYEIELKNGTSTCCKKWSTQPNPVFDIEVVSVGTTEVTLTWKNLDLAASEYEYVVHAGKEIKVIPKQHVNVTITDLEPGTYYVFFISPKLENGTQGSLKTVTVTTKPNPVSELQITDVGIAEATVSWHSDNSTVATRILLEGFEDETNSPSQVLLNISGLEPGFQYRFSLFLPEPCQAQGDPNATQSRTGADSKDIDMVDDSLQPAFEPNTLVYKCNLQKGAQLVAEIPQDTRVNLFGLNSGTSYQVTVLSQAANGTEGDPQKRIFKTNSSQVVNVQVEEVSDTEVKLAWENSDNSSSGYTYRIHVAGDGHSFDQNSNNTHVAIRGLNSSTLYNFTVYPKRNQDPEGQPAFTQTYTAPLPVSEFRVQNVSTTSVSLAWNSEGSSFRILVQELTNHSFPRNETHQEKRLLVTDLTPGTPYCFEIFPRAPDGREGLSRKLEQTTEPSAVSDIEVVSVNTTVIHLKWQNRDNTSLGYRYHLLVETDGSWVFNSTTDFLNETIGGLVPGTCYNVTIYPEIGNGTKGSPTSKVLYTRPSPVSTINISSITTTEVTLSWQETDSGSTSYTYLIILVEGGSVSPISTSINQTLRVRNATVTDLSPGTSYEVRIYSQVGEDALQGEPGLTSFCTDAASVAFLECNPVPKQSTLILRWPCPPGMNSGFSLTIHSGEWSQEISLPPCNSTDVADDFNVTHLNYSTTYSISLTTLSCGKKSFPIQNVSQTSITDPPPPDGLPNIFPISHNSLKVKFGKFEASHGPITAYAVILTTDGSGNKSSVDFLKYTYDDFKKGTSKTYVTYLMSVKEERAASALSDVLKYEVIVGNESTTDGYYNGKLEPLNSYRACIAGFTNIAFDSLHLINGTESYVSFSLYSDAISLPQNPAVICGAVFGCIFGALVIVAVGGFIFWRRKRKDAKNSDVSFSQIKSKVIKVENFESYFKKQQADSNCGFAEEYEDLKLIGVNQPKFAAEIPENRGKNRYNNVLPYDISRVKLSIQTQVTDDYINANYMPGYYSKKDFIATQGPLPNTLKDFWRMVWEKNIYSIVMLTKCVEQGRTKCEEYWPSKQTQNYGDITVGIISEIILPEWTIRDFTVKNNKTSESHPLRQFHFTSWPDHGVPDTTDLLINFRYLVNDYMKQSPPESPVLVHCSAGVGRTGTFIAIDRLIHQMENENAVDVYGIVYDLRLHRPLMVQTEDQYVFLNQCVWDIIKSQKDSKADLIYQNTTAMTIYENLAPVTAFGKTNGYIA
ncbi:receptor-type tyrosine-protein phosphatase eta isoform X1 [Phascolarctos cinereus]|uniref:Receptor-type tyrosine-protein phosphatase eta n=1 Tax=Phascolarctos cinereus TaxID=38626 RepID=A0A6P5MA12_PHACI|nr:receptor-type tyrosine-protein phosphatase eta isoform X2 [Phascolarctos cinereus]